MRADGRHQPEQIALVEKNTRASTEIPGIRSVETDGNMNLVPRSEGYDHVTGIDLDAPEFSRAS